MTEIAERPWGEWKVVHQEQATAHQKETTVKVLTINPGCMLSLQAHRKREEFWVALSYGLVAYVYQPSHIGVFSEIADGESRQALLLPVHKVFKIPFGTVHRLVNPTAHPVSLVEIITGSYDEDDITRLHDAYGRV